MYALIYGEVTGPCAATLDALPYMKDHLGLLAALGPDEVVPLTTAELTDSFRRFFEGGMRSNFISSPSRFIREVAGYARPPQSSVRRPGRPGRRTMGTGEACNVGFEAGARRGTLLP